MPEDAAPSPPAPPLYSEHQILVLTALLSPVGGWALLIANLRRLGERRTAWLAAASAAVLTAALIGLGRIGRGHGGFPVRPLAEGVSVGATWLVLQLWMHEAWLAHRAEGGPVRSSWRAFGIALASVGAAGALAVVAIALSPRWLVDELRACVTFAAHEDVCYADGATDADARALGAALQRLRLFDGHRAIRARTKRPGGRLVLSLPFSQGGLDAALRARFADFTVQIRRQLPQIEPFELDLCDASWNVVATFSD